MLTHIELTTAKSYAKLETQTPFQKRELVRFLYKLGTNEIKHFQTDQVGFEKVLEIAIKYFRDENKIHGDTRKLL